MTVPLFPLFAIALTPQSQLRHAMRVRPRLCSRARDTLCASQVIVEADEESVGLALCGILEAEYKKAVSNKGQFVFCISGGSMLKMLSSLAGDSTIDWSRCTMVLFMPLTGSIETHPQSIDHLPPAYFAGLR